jgi:aminopeptidase N
MKNKILFFLITVLLSSCYYKPFVGYRFNKSGFKNFNKKEHFAGDNANPFRNYDVKKYVWNLEIFPNKKKVSGDVIMEFVVGRSQNIFIFDFKKGMKVTTYKSSLGEPELKQKGDLLYLTYADNVPLGTRISLMIEYNGKPKNIAGEGPLQWKKDNKGRHWISTSTEGIGPHFIMPCNGLLRDEPDTTEINITVPNNLVVAANGRLIDVSENKKNLTKTFKHLVTNPINIYNISFNIGHFVTLEKKYTDINGVDRVIECQVMDYNEEKADTFYNQAPKIMKVFEELYGTFPWWNDGCRFIESTFSAMEHQSGIAMGDDYRYDWEEYNLTLVHELSHEWWGNNITAYDYCDAWIHEGLATYSEALFLEKVYGKEAYKKKVMRFYYGTANKIPIKKVCGVQYSSWISYYDMDIYDKGALMMHSLRILVNDDDLFFKSLKTFQKDLSRSNISSDHFIQKFNNLLGNDYSLMFDLYLNEVEPPYLNLKIDFENSKKVINYKWSNPLPFELKNGIVVLIENKEVVLYPNSEFQKLEVGFDVEVNFLTSKSIYFLLKKEGTKK